MFQRYTCTCTEATNTTPNTCIYFLKLMVVFFMCFTCIFDLCSMTLGLHNISKFMSNNKFIERKKLKYGTIN